MSHTETARNLALQQLTQGLMLVALRALGDRDQAEDAAQEAVIRVLAVLDTKGIPTGYTLETYAYGILKHVVLDQLRARKRRAILPAWLAVVPRTPFDELVSAERARTIARALDHLEARDRELLERCYFKGERVVEIAEQTGEPPERIRKRKSRALERLRSILGARGHIRLSMDD